MHRWILNRSGVRVCPNPRPVATVCGKFIGSGVIKEKKKIHNRTRHSTAKNLAHWRICTPYREILPATWFSQGKLISYEPFEGRCGVLTQRQTTKCALEYEAVRMVPICSPVCIQRVPSNTQMRSTKRNFGFSTVTSEVLCSCVLSSLRTRFRQILLNLFRIPNTVENSKKINLFLHVLKDSSSKLQTYESLIILYKDILNALKFVAGIRELNENSFLSVP